MASRFPFVSTSSSLGAYFGAVLALSVARFGSTPENLRYQLFFLLIPAAIVAAVSRGSEGLNRRWVLTTLVTLAGFVLLLQAAFKPTTEARGYVLAAIAWLSFFVALRIGSERGSLRILFLVLILIGAGEALYGLLQAVGGVDQIGGYARNLSRIATGTFINRNHFAGLLNLTLGLSLGALYTGYAARRHAGQRSSETFAWTWLVIMSCAVVGLAIFLSLSRGGSLILIAELVFVFVLLQVRAQVRRHRHGHRERHAMPARIAFVLLVATLAVGFTYGIDALLERFDTIEVSERPQIYRDTLEMIADHPWAGIGPGMYGYRFRAYQTVGLARQYSQAHNDYLHVAAEWGVPLAIVFWGFVAWCFWRSVRLFLSHASPWRQGVGLGSAAAIFTLLLHSLVDFNLQIPANLAVFSAILGLSLAAEPARDWRPTEVPTEPSPALVNPARRLRLSQLLFLILLPLALLAAAWRVVPRMVATQIVAGKDAPAVLERAARWDPQNPDYPYLLGRYYKDIAGLRDLETARGYLERAAELAPWGWRAQWELAQLYELLGDGDRAEEALLRATSLSPRDPTLQWQLANLYLRTGEFEKMFPPLAVALAGDRSLWHPGLGLLTKTGLTENESGLETVDEIWPEGRDARLVLLEGLVKSPDPEQHAFLRGEWDELLAAREPPSVAQGAFFVSYLLDPLRRNSAAEAREAWIRLAAANDLEDRAFESEQNRVWNGRFELELTRSPLDWRLWLEKGYTVAVAPREGVYDSNALRVDFDGSENLDFSHVRQTTAVRGGTSYELSYRARSEELTTERGVFLEVYDPGANQMLLQTEPVLGTTPWTLSLLTFETPPTSDRIELRMRRLKSRRIAGNLEGTFWLDNVSVAQRERSVLGAQTAQHEAPFRSGKTTR